MIVQLLSRYLCIDNTNQQNITINVYTLFVASTYVITFLCYISNIIKNRVIWKKFRLYMEK